MSLQTTSNTFVRTSDAHHTSTVMQANAVSMSNGLIAYRNLLRAIRLAFQGDLPVLSAARATAREKFDELRDISTAAEKQDALSHAQQVTKILRENIVQGRNLGDDKYKLNIHEHTERGDNATVKKLDSRVKSFKDMKG